VLSPRRLEPSLHRSRRRILIVIGAIGAVAIWAAVTALTEPYDWTTIGTGHDARPYWAAAFQTPYATSRVGEPNAYLYSPAFLQMIAPLRALPWQAFVGAWTVLLIAATVYLVGPALLAVGLLIALPEIFGGNITLMLGAAIVLGFRWPATWSFLLLTKVTPGIGLLWFAVRREWRALGIAAGATLLFVAISYALAPPGVWAEWVRELSSNATAPIDSGSLPVPLLARLPVAALVIAWGAAGNRRWALPIGCLLALPVIWYGSLSLLVAVIPLIGSREVAAVRGWWTGRRGATRPTASAAPARR
jgi:hypothetical protein